MLVSSTLETVADPMPVAGNQLDERRRWPYSLRRLGLRRLQKLSMIGLFLIVALTIISVFPYFFTSQDPNAQSLPIALQGPSGAHWLGTEMYSVETSTHV